MSTRVSNARLWVHISTRSVTAACAVLLLGTGAVGHGTRESATDAPTSLVTKQLFDVPSRLRAPTVSRSGPEPQYPTVSRYRAGDAVSVDSALGRWCMINSADAEFVPCGSLVAPRGGWVIGKTVKKSCWPHCGN